MGMGGNGIVVLVNSEDQIACAKLLLSSKTSDYHLARLTREHMALSMLGDVAGVPHILAYSLENASTAYIVMTSVGTMDLQEKVGGFQAQQLLLLSKSDAMVILKQLLEIIRECHVRSVLHRDIKANNIRIDDSNKVHLIDFGLAFLGAEDSDEETITKEGFSNGLLQLPEFAYPGQMRSKVSDLTLILAVYHFLRTGEKKMCLLQKPPNSQSTIYDLQEMTLLHRAFCPNPEHRWQDVADIEAHLQLDESALCDVRFNQQQTETHFAYINFALEAIIPVIERVAPKKKYSRIIRDKSTPRSGSLTIIHDD
ncbi:MAG: protein kinase domain-containing protein, partial [Candidatus Bathyarchaeia archaeon]